MLDLNWIDVILFATYIPALYLIFVQTYTNQSLSNLFFGFSILSLFFGLILSYFDFFKSLPIREWGSLVAITCVLTALFNLIRDFKPKFVRFPIPMTFFPLIGLFFYPLVINNSVVKDLLHITYQGGALSVSLLIVSLNYVLYKQRMLLMFSLLFFSIAYLFNWFPQLFTVNDYTQTFTSISMSIGILIGTIGLKKLSIVK
jgi:hypothetical protein